MGLILKGPIELSDVVNLISNGSHSFYKKKNQTGFYSISLSMWTPEDTMLRLPSCTCNFSPEVYNTYLILRQRNLLQSLSNFLGSNPERFACTINCWGGLYFRDCYWNGRYRDFTDEPDVKTRIINLTLMEDILSGQTFPAPTKAFAIFSLYSEHKGYCKYVENVGSIEISQFVYDYWDYITSLVLEAQKRIDGMVSKSAHNILKDLHS